MALPSASRMDLADMVKLGRQTTLSHRVDVDVVLGVLGVRDERLNEEMSQDASGVLNLLLLQGTLSNPSTSLSPSLVKSQETSLATTLDELIGLCNELGTILEEPREAQLSLVENSVDIVIVVEVQRGESGRRVVLGGLGKRARLDDIGAGEVVVDDGLAIGLVDSLCGHGVGGLWELKREGRVFCFPVECSKTRSSRLKRAGEVIEENWRTTNNNEK
jgi:hypothetical protein